MKKTQKFSINPNFSPKFRQKIKLKYDIFKLKTKYDIFKQYAYVVIYGTNTFFGKIFDLLLLFFIVVSVFAVMLESVQDVNNQYHRLLIVLEWLITFFFSVEYVLRIVSNDKPLRYVFSFYGIVDLISILPMYLSFFIPGSKMLATIRIFRLLRIFRILSLPQFTNESNKLLQALRMSRPKILIFIYFVLVICVFLGTIMYMVESPENGFTSIPQSVYWCIVTLTTVGYGDIAPATTLGQIISSAIMIIGYGIIAVPTGIVTAEYNRMKSEIQEEKNNSFVEKKCILCTETDFPPNALYCHKCGNLLLNKKL